MTGRPPYLTEEELRIFRQHDSAQLPFDKNRWGNRTLLASGINNIPGSRKRATVVDTESLVVPTVWAVRTRFQSALPTGNPVIDESRWGPLPQSGGVSAIVRRALDENATLTDERYTVGLNMPEFYLAKKLMIDFQMEDDEGPTSDFVECIAVPVCCVDGSVLGTGLAGDLGGYGTTVVTRVAVTTIDNSLLLNANQFRRQFYIQNNSTQTLAVKLGSGASDNAGAESWTFLLPGGANACYESPIGGYTGIITGVWFGADAAGEALITEGRNP